MNNLNQTFVENVTFNKPACWGSHPNVGNKHSVNKFRLYMHELH